MPSEALVLANVGDSRTYLFRHGRLRRVTVDHSYVQELVATGHIDEEEARAHPRRNIITRALGIEPDVRVDWWTLPLIRGDRFVLCSDGLVDEVADTDITAMLLADSRPAGGRRATRRRGQRRRRARQHHRHRGRRARRRRPAGPDARDRRRADVGRLGHAAHARRHASPSTPTPPADANRDRLERTAAAGDADAPIRSAIGPRQVRHRLRRGRRHRGRCSWCSRRGRGAAISWRSTATTRRSSTRVATAGCSGSIRPRRTTRGPTRDQLEPDRADEIDDDVRFDSEQEAADFIRDSATTTTTTTTTTTSTTTTTTLPPTTIDPNAVDRPERGGPERHRERRGRTDRGHDHQLAMTFADEFAAGRDRAYSPFAQRRRNTELTLLVMAALITGVGLHDHRARHERRDPAGYRPLRRHPAWACCCAPTSSCASSPAAPTARCSPSPRCSTASDS